MSPKNRIAIYSIIASYAPNIHSQVLVAEGATVARKRNVKDPDKAEFRYLVNVLAIGVNLGKWPWS